MKKYVEFIIHTCFAIGTAYGVWFYWTGGQYPIIFAVIVVIIVGPVLWSILKAILEEGR